MKFTQWHDGDVKPVHEGVYERLYNEPTGNIKIYFCLFFGGSWFYYTETGESAALEIFPSSFQNEIRWRGLAVKP